MKKTFIIDDVEDILTFINTNIKKHKLKKNEENRASLMAEEILLLMQDHASEKELSVNISYLGGILQIRMSARGKPFDPFDDSDADEIRSALLQSFADDIRCRHHRGTNIITISAYRSRYMLLTRMAEAAAIGLVVSLVLKAALPASASAYIAANLMTPGKDMFMNCLNMLIPPLVFFSIASAISGFGNTSQLGRISGKIIGIYMMTTAFATILGFVLVEVLKPYNFGTVLTSAAITEAEMNLSFIETIMKIIPENFIQAFLDGDTIQIIFLAAFLGLAVTSVGAKAKPIQDFIDAGNEVFLRMTNMLISFMPFMIFCTIGSTLLSPSGAGKGLGLPILAGIGVYLISIVLLIIFYHLLLKFLGRLKPMTFTRKYAPYLLQIMGMGSSSAAIPLNMQICDDLGVSKKVYSLSIPLGATINMDGTTIYMAVFGLLLAHMYGLQLNLSVYVMMTFAILMLSAGAPPVMGASIICLSALLKTIGIPVSDAITMVLGVEVIAGLVRTVNNAICDMVGTLIVAKQENLLDEEKYYSEKK